MTELKNYVELEHIATGYPVVIALNSKECQLLSHYYNVREDEIISYEDFKSYESEAYESLEKRMQLNGIFKKMKVCLKTISLRNLSFKMNMVKQLFLKDVILSHHE